MNQIMMMNQTLILMSKMNIQNAKFPHKNKMRKSITKKFLNSIYKFKIIQKTTKPKIKIV